MAFEELLNWASNRPTWQRDALRRLAEQGELTEANLSELRRQIEVEEGLPAEAPLAPVPLAADHLSEATSNEPKTVMASLGPVAHVDRLAPNQRPLRFAINGITLVYGPNASGKSGYCRIAKRLCRSLVPVALRGNVYEEGPVQPPEVGLAYRVGGDGDPKTELTWKGNEPPPADLARISVFDTACARVYVDSERRIEFLPYELDLLNKLGLAARSLDRDFKTREDALNAAIRIPLPAGYLEGTAVSRFLAKLVPATALNDLPSEAALCALAAWSPQDQTTLDELIAQSKTDPQAMRRLREEAKQALTTLKEEIAAIEQRLGVSAIEDLGRKHDDAVAKRGAADATAHDLFRAEPIPNVGTESWRQMFLYAREFAASVFPEAAPPQIATAGKCVLCQQDTDKQAADRLAAFDRYLSGKSAEEAAAAERTLAQAIASVTTAPVKRKQDVDSVLAGYAALTAASKQNAASIAAFFEKAAARLNALQQLIAQGAFEKLATLDPLPASPAATIDKERQSLTTEAQQLEQAERDEAAMRDRALRLAELIDRKKLSQEVEGVVERRNKLEERHRVGACRAQCRLTAITQQITNRRREILTPSLKQALQDQLKALQLTHLHVNLEDRGELGDSIVEVSLSAQQRIANNSEVLSEGEQRGLALACFFAELKEIGRDHGIIVDDPVSSLDHTRMQAVARRLAEEAATGRQVIVFSHNILFHYMLKTEARCAKVGWQEEWMTSLGDGRFGIIDDAQKPWQMKPVSERLTEIDQSLKALAKGYDPKDEKLRGAVVALYTNLRTTWERVVEEILFNRVIQRFRPEIMTQSLKAAYFDPEKDYPVLFEGMKRASHYSGHDAAEDLPTELPPLADIERDIKDLHDFSTQARERKKKFEKALGDYDAGIKPVLL